MTSAASQGTRCATRAAASRCVLATAGAAGARKILRAGADPSADDGGTTPSAYGSISVRAPARRVRTVVAMKLRFLPWSLALPVALSFAMSSAVYADDAPAVGVALVGDDVLAATARDAVRAALRDAGHVVLDDAEVRAAVDARGACADGDVPCLGRIALLADAGAVVSFVRRGEEIDVVVVDADARVGRATTSSARVGSAVVDAIASLGKPDTKSAPVEEPPHVAVEEPPHVEPAHVEAAHVEAAHVEAAHVDPVKDEPVKEEPVKDEPALAHDDASARMNPWALAGAGLAGAGIVALAAGSYAAALAGGSMQEAEAAPFQDDAARFGNTANEQLWLSGGAFALGVGAMAGGAALIFLDGGEP